MKLGTFDYLSKPCEVENLKIMILEAAMEKEDFTERIYYDPCRGVVYQICTMGLLRVSLEKEPTK
jgi:hypothetical protein